MADCALMTQAACRTQWEEMHPGRRLVAARTKWTDELKEMLRTARNSKPGMPWADIVSANDALSDIGEVSRRSRTQQ